MIILLLFKHYNMYVSYLVFTIFFSGYCKAEKHYRRDFGSNYDQEITPSVKKDTVIKVKESMKNGARRLDSQKVEDATECYNLCKDLYFSEGCNIAQMHYKNGDDENIIKFCYLFSCGFPSSCIFKFNVSRFHVIGLNAVGHEVKFLSSLPEANINVNKDTNKGRESTKHTSPPTQKPTTTYSPKPHSEKPKSTTTDEECPPGTPMAMCSDDPCKIHKCENHPDAVCKANYCGGCNAKFYTKSGSLLDCKVIHQSPKAEGDILTQHNEQAVVIGETDYEEKPDELYLPPIHKTDLKSEKKASGDEYYQTERRKWVDQGGEGIISSVLSTKKPRSTVATTRVVEKTTIIAYRSYFTIPLLIALITCVGLLCYVLYRYRCRRGKPKKFPVDDGDYLINGMYL